MLKLLNKTRLNLMRKSLIERTFAEQIPVDQDEQESKPKKVDFEQIEREMRIIEKEETSEIKLNYRKLRLESAEVQS